MSCTTNDQMTSSKQTKPTLKILLCSLLAALLLSRSRWRQMSSPVAAQQEARRSRTRPKRCRHARSDPEGARGDARVFIVAHPDDEASTLLTYLPHGLGTDTTLLTLNRGEGGQNAIGPEQGPQLGILRSAELSAAMNVEGPHLYFTRVIDFGFSKTLEETLEKWQGWNSKTWCA